MSRVWMVVRSPIALSCSASYTFNTSGLTLLSCATSSLVLLPSQAASMALASDSERAKGFSQKNPFIPGSAQAMTVPA